MTGMFLTRHALQRIREMSVTHGEVRRVLAEPETMYPAYCGRTMSVKGQLAVVHEGDVVITVLWHTTERWERSTARKAS